ncbi:hypothetical protein [Rhodospirillum sp. A1_3_36]|uniref:hypothetical protein n=1 Tax=Rhodospirillum sp. A1_3_36 TaxID=3391666 RepID=UPI0039A43143
MPQGVFLTFPKIVVWTGMCCLLFVLQIFMGTNIIQSILTLIIFFIFPFVIQSYVKINSVGAYVVGATFIKLFIVSQWLKVAFLQAADTNLEEPFLTVVFLLQGLVGLWVAVFPLWVLTGRRGGVFKPSQNPTFLFQLALFSIALCLFSIVARSYLNIDRYGDAESLDGRGFVLFSFLGQMGALAVAAFSVRVHILSGGRRFVDRYVVAMLIFGFFHGIWENQRTLMLAGFVALAATYLSYGGRVKKGHVALVLLAAAFMQVIVFPVIDIQRSFLKSRSPTALQTLESTADVASNMLNSSEREEYDDSLDRLYRSWYTRLYYGEPRGFLDRFAPNPFGEAIEHYKNLAPVGVSHFVGQMSYGVPNLILKPLGIERPIRSTTMMEADIFQSATNMNYGVFADLYASLGGDYFFLGCIIVSVLYFASLHLIYGGFRNNYFAAFGFSTSYFVFADSDFAEIVFRITIQGVMYLILLMVFTFLVGRDGLSARGVTRA